LRFPAAVAVVLMFSGFLCPLVHSGEQNEPRGPRRCPIDMVAADTFCIDTYEHPGKLGVKPRNLVTYTEAL